jgi:hypothetical protein
LLGLFGDGDSNEITITMIHTLQSGSLYLKYIFTVYCSMFSTVAIPLLQMSPTRPRSLHSKEYYLEGGKKWGT